MAIIVSPYRQFLLAVALTALAAPAAQAQFSDGYNFLKSVRERKGDDAEKFISEPGSVIINTREDSSGETALHIVVSRRDSEWLGYLLGRGANPNIADKKGLTPLMLATQYGFADGAMLLLRYKANIDGTNRGGETPLIRAVQLRNAEMVRLLMKAGANADKKDSITGQSAREYATLDGRSNAILAIIETKGQIAEPKKEKQGDLDFSGITEEK
jgi:uncharacterized protein